MKKLVLGIVATVLFSTVAVYAGKEKKASKKKCAKTECSKKCCDKAGCPKSSCANMPGCARP